MKRVGREGLGGVSREVGSMFMWVLLDRWQAGISMMGCEGEESWWRW